MAEATRILIVDDQPSILTLLSTILKAEGYEVVAAQGGEEAVQLLTTNTVDLIITDIQMSPMSGMDLAAHVAEQNLGAPLIMMTGYGSVETAIGGMRLGVFDYVPKPFKVDEFLLTVKRALGLTARKSESENLNLYLEREYRFLGLIEESQEMKDVGDAILRIAPTDTAVLIVGEPGTERELIARTIHANSLRKGKPFATLRCAALGELQIATELLGFVPGAYPGANMDQPSLLERVNGGTLYLADVDSLPISAQEGILMVFRERAIQRVGSEEKHAVDVRILASTNVDLAALRDQGGFRPDLYQRLSIIPIAVAPLRGRKEDIMPIAARILREEISKDESLPVLTTEVQSILRSYLWPGNVEELRDALTHALTVAQNATIAVESLPPHIVNAVRLGPGGGVSDEEYRGRLLKDFLRTKKTEYLDQARAKATEALRQVQRKETPEE